MLALPGSVYLYQGEELGLPEVHDLPFEVLEDPVWVRSGNSLKGRDGCRVPIPWTIAGPSCGFSDDGSWLPQPNDWGVRSVEAQDGADQSTLELYKAALAIRRRELDGDDSLAWADLGDEVVAFRRGSRVDVVVNFGSEPIAIPEGMVLLTSGDLVDGLLPGDSAVWLRPAAVM
jgi:alpha-glucosidase